MLSDSDLTRLRLAADVKRDDEFISITAGELRGLIKLALLELQRQDNDDADSVPPALLK